MGYKQLIRTNPRSIGFGFLNAFFSGLGQTHFISVFSPTIMAYFALSNTEYGSLYSLVTLLSGVSISFLGPLIDRYDLRFFSLFIGLGLILSQSLISYSQKLFFLGLGLYGLRLFGQGLCSSLSSIAIARYFSEQRGKALSLSQLGFPVYEGLITPLFAFLLSVISFNSIHLILIFSVILIYLPLSFQLTKKIDGFNKVKIASSNETLEVFEKSWSRREVFTDKTIYFLLPQALMPPFALTGVFFHQAAIAQSKGLSLSLMASGLIFFAIGRIITTFLTGPLVDRFKAFQLFPFYQLPLTFSFLVLATFSTFWTPALCFFLFGLAVGSGGPIKSAIWAEIYGVLHLGSIKSAFATIMVFSTAISPALFGYFIDKEQGVTSLLASLFVCSFICSFLAYWGLKAQRKSEYVL